MVYLTSNKDTVGYCSTSVVCGDQPANNVCMCGGVVCYTGDRDTLMSRQLLVVSTKSISDVIRFWGIIDLI